MKEDLQNFEKCYIINNCKPLFTFIANCNDQQNDFSFVLQGYEVCFER